MSGSFGQGTCRPQPARSMIASKSSLQLNNTSTALTSTSLCCSASASRARSELATAELGMGLIFAACFPAKSWRCNTTNANTQACFQRILFYRDKPSRQTHLPARVGHGLIREVALGAFRVVAQCGSAEQRQQQPSSRLLRTASTLRDLPVRRCLVEQSLHALLPAELLADPALNYHAQEILQQDQPAHRTSPNVYSGKRRHQEEECQRVRTCECSCRVQQAACGCAQA